jgi:hypothetical protein
LSRKSHGYGFANGKGRAAQVDHVIDQRARGQRLDGRAERSPRDIQSAKQGRWKGGMRVGSDGWNASADHHGGARHGWIHSGTLEGNVEHYRPVAGVRRDLRRETSRSKAAGRSAATAHR